MKYEKKISDYHVHSHWSPDSSMETLSILEVCREKGILDIAFTDHTDLFFPKKSNLGFDIPAYQKEINKLKRYYSDINILAGIEVGVNQSNLDETEKFLQKHSFDFVIASIHSTEKFSFCNRSMLKDFSKNDLLNTYLEEMVFVTENLKGYQVLGHMDYLLRYHPFSTDEFLSHSKQINKILHNLTEGNHGIEINTKGWIHENKQNPMFEILKLFKKLGGTYITIGSDSHSLNQLGNHFYEAADLIKKASFDEYYLFKNREWIPVPISGYLF
jgi:histidinol-phosphatase (PHP family)